MSFLNKVVQGDCLEVMQEIKTGSVDMILADLPYGTTQNSWDTIIPFEPLWEQYNRIIKDNGAIVLTAAKPFSAMLVMSNPKMFRYDIIWKKNKATGFLNANNQPLRNHEEVLIFYKNQPVYNPQKTTGHKPVNYFKKNTSDGSNYGKTKMGLEGGGQTDRFPTSVLEINVVNNDGDEKYHPTQKPVELGKWFIRTFTNPGQTVLDNTAGSGSFLVSAAEIDRNFIGIEKNYDFCSIAEERLKLVQGELIV